MKFILFLINIIPISFAFAQNDASTQKDFKWNTKIYYNDNNKEVKQREGTSYLLCQLNGNEILTGIAKQYSVKKDQLLWEGSFFLFNRKEPIRNKYHVLCKWYYKNGQVSRESNYVDGLLNGKTIFYDEGNTKTYSGNYQKGKLDGGRFTQYNDDGTTSKVYMQNFDSFYDSWGEEDVKDGSSNFNNGAMWLRSSSNDGYTRKEYMQVDTKNDFSIETGLKLWRGETSTIVYGQKDYQNYKGIQINNRGYLKLLNVYEGINVEKSEWYKISINSKWNILKILRMGDNVYVSFNGNVVTSYKFNKLYGNYFGFYLPKKNDELGISYITTKEFSYKTRNDGDNSENTKSQSPRQKTTQTTSVSGNFTDISDESWNPSGTGFYVASNGLIVTNNHVIDNANVIGITQFINGRKTILKAKVILTDPQNDLALLQVDDSRFVSPGVIPYSIKPDVADVGESIFTMGYPLSNILGDEIKITDGIISARSGLQGDSKMYQISASITYGNSGGPLFDKEGNLLGMNSSGIANKNIAENTGYSIKTSMILNLLNSSNDAINIDNRNILKGKALKEQIKVLRNFVPMICTQ